MDERQLGLIQRAAARLKQVEASPDVRPATKFSSLALAHRQARASAEPKSEEVEGLQARETLLGTSPRPVDVPEVIVDRGQLAQAGIAFPSDERSRLAEEFRVIKRQVLATAQKNQANDGARCARLVLVTSAKPLEGKTFVAANLALAIASERDLHVLAIDCDSARQNLGAMLGVGSKPGLGDFLHGEKSDISEILFHTNIPNLTVIPFGKRHANMPEMLSSNRTKELLGEMGRRYSDRYLILDAPPCLAASDASILAPLVGQIVFVVEANRTQQQEIEEGLRLVSACPNISLILNKADRTFPEQFGSHGYY